MRKYLLLFISFVTFSGVSIAAGGTFYATYGGSTYGPFNTPSSSCADVGAALLVALAPTGYLYSCTTDPVQNNAVVVVVSGVTYSFSISQLTATSPVLDQNAKIAALESTNSVLSSQVASLQFQTDLLKSTVDTVFAQQIPEPLDSTQATRLWLSGMFVVLSLYTMAWGIGWALRMFKKR